MSANVMHVDPHGVNWWPRLPPGFTAARLAEEATRCAAILERAVPPGRVSTEISAAPARGPAIAETPRETVMTENGPRVRLSQDRRPDGTGWGDRVRLGDAFDVMEEQGFKAWKKQTRGLEREGKPIRPFVPPFTKGQVEIGREYARLVERCAAAGVKCSSLEALSAGGSGGDREAAIFRDFQRLRVFHARIGDGLAKEVRRIRPGGKRRAIRVRVLVDQVCCGGLTLTGVLAAHGWQNLNGKMREALRAALAAALDRMIGFDLVQP